MELDLRGRRHRSIDPAVPFLSGIAELELPAQPDGSSAEQPVDDVSTPSAANTATRSADVEVEATYSISEYDETHILGYN